MGAQHSRPDAWASRNYDMGWSRLWDAMPLLYPQSEISAEATGVLFQGLENDLAELRKEFDGPPNAPQHEARLRSIRDLIDDLLVFASSETTSSPHSTVRRELANALYSASIVAAEYYKLFVRPPSARHPAGAI